MKIKKIFKNPYLWAFFMGIASLHIIKHCALLRRQAPEPMVDVPAWNLLNQQGEKFGQQDLLGKIVIADFFFTSCPSICPKLTEAMKELHTRFLANSSDVAFLSISVDPETDTPERLRSFIAQHDLNYPNWHFLTGTKAEVYDVVVEKMRIHMGERANLKDSQEIYDIPHLAHIALFDQEGRLRALFKTDSIELSALVRGAKFLLEKAKKP
jgi:protein SCO1/2